MLSVGTELSTLDGAADHAAWAAAVAAVRRVFHGPLMYSGNWDHYRDVAVYDLVDIVGLCGYFALVEPDAPATVDDLTRGWRDWRVELERFFAPRGRAIVFTELGYRSIRGAGAAPWDEASPGDRRSRRAAPLLRRLPPRLRPRAARSLRRRLLLELVRLGRRDVARLHAARQAGARRAARVLQR